MALSNPQSATQLVTEFALRLTSGDKDPIRGWKAPDGRKVFSVYDAMWNTGAYPSKGVVAKTFSRMISEGSDTKEEVQTLIVPVHQISRSRAAFDPLYGHQGAPVPHCPAWGQDLGGVQAPGRDDTHQTGGGGRDNDWGD